MTTMPKKHNAHKKMHVKKGDRVRVISGNYRGYEGKILVTFPEKQRVIVEGVNLRFHHEKPSGANPQGGRIEKEVPVHVSNVQPIASDGNPDARGPQAHYGYGNRPRPMGPLCKIHGGRASVTPAPGCRAMVSPHPCSGE